MSALIATIGNASGDRNGGALADQVTEAFEVLLNALLDREDPHDWDHSTVPGADGKPREVKVFPLVFMQRLERAVETGAFGRMSPREVAQRILTTEAPQ